MTKKGNCSHLHLRDDEAPPGYIRRSEWAKKMGRTHNQRKCPECGLYKVWVLKKKRLSNYRRNSLL